VLNEFLLSQLEATFDDLLACCADADLIVSSDAVIPAGLAAFAVGIPWVHTCITPLSLPLNRASADVRNHRAQIIKARARALAALCKARGLAPAAMVHRPIAAVALISPTLLEGVTWQTRDIQAVGFSFYEGEETHLDARMVDFLEAGEPPVVFTFGSANFIAMKSLHEVSLAAAATLGLRAVILGSAKYADPSCASSTGRSAFAGTHASYAELFPRACAIVHHGGIGTIARALRAGKPMVITPFFVDQPFNAMQAERLGVARVLPPENYNVDTLVEELGRVLAERRYAQTARRLSEVVAKEDGAAGARRIIERLMAGRSDRVPTRQVPVS
jgi:UDP:flavonoid glycosyltransferase YjiC (YdhE family)